MAIRIKIDRELRRQRMLKATPLERRMIALRDIARCRSPRRAYLWIVEGLQPWLEEKNRFTDEELKTIKTELERVQKMTEEELYEELKIVP